VTRRPSGGTRAGGADGVRYVADVVVTMDARARVLRPGAVEVNGDRISWVGPASEHGAAEREIVVGGLLMPGLVNAHGHSPMTLFRSAGDGLPLERWLADVIWPREARLRADDVAWGMRLGAAELLRNGVTSTCELYLHPRAVADAALEAGIRCIVAPGVFDLAGAGPEGSWRRLLDEAARLHDELRGHEPVLSVAIGPHAAYTLPEEGLLAVAKVAAELEALVHIHVAETRAEGRLVDARYGCSAPELLARTGVLDCRVLAAHCVWLSESDVDLFQRHDVAVAHCPQSNGKLGSGMAPVDEMLGRGLRVGIGTDGPASNDNLDLWEEMRLAPLLARARRADPGALSTLDALALATRGGADALGVPAGRLAVGALADIIRLDLDDPAFVPALSDEDLLAHLVWAASSRLVTDVWVGGRQVVAGRRCLTVDEEAARHEVALRARRLAGLDTGP